MFDEFLDNAIHGGDNDELNYEPIEIQRFLIDFNIQIEKQIQSHGVEKIGDAVWFLYGCVGDFAREALDQSVSAGFKGFYQSLEVLYDQGFANHCSRELGHFNKLETACYMLWDMDSGLEFLSFNGRPELFELTEKLIDFGLQHDHPAVQESFIHCLGHREYLIPDFVHGKLDRYLFRNDIKSELREYAQNAKSGMIQ